QGDRAALRATRGRPRRRPMMEEPNRMRHMLPVLVCAALLAACGKKKEEKPPTPPPGPEKVVAPTKPSPLASCDTLLPKPRRADLSPGEAMLPTAPQITAAGTILTCMFGKPGPDQQIVQVNCSNIAMGTIDTEVKEVKGRMTEVKDVP